MDLMQETVSEDPPGIVRQNQRNPSGLTSSTTSTIGSLGGLKGSILSVGSDVRGGEERISIMSLTGVADAIINEEDGSLGASDGSTNPNGLHRPDAKDDSNTEAD